MGKVAPLRPTKIPGGVLTGEEVPMLFHAGKKLLKTTTEVKRGFFEGWYGWGFYMAFDAEFCRRWYGPKVTAFKVVPEAKVLSAACNYASAPDGLLEEILANDLKFTLDGDVSKLPELRERLMVNPMQWIHGVDRLVIEKYDVVVYQDENVVLKVPEMVTVEGEASDAFDYRKASPAEVFKRTGLRI